MGSEIQDEFSGNLLDRWRAGDQGAAGELFRRYASRLIALAASRLPAKLAHRIDPEELVQSVYRSFFAQARESNYELQRGGDLWRLLVTITLNKLYNQVDHNTAEKRAVGRERNLRDLAQPNFFARDPSPTDAAVLADEVEQLMRRLDPIERQILELRLQSHDLDEIAAATKRSQRTVRRVLDRVKEHLQQAALRDARV